VTTTPQLDLRRLVVTGSSRRPDLADRLNRAADIVRYSPPKSVSRNARLWLCPSERRENVCYLVDRTAKTCQCPDHQAYRNACTRGSTTKRIGAPSGLCKHRLAVEMFCRLNNEPDAPDEEKTA
jgi:hypothetical protein